MASFLLTRDSNQDRMRKVIGRLVFRLMSELTGTKSAMTDFRGMGRQVCACVICCGNRVIPSDVIPRAWGRNERKID